LLPAILGGVSGAFHTMGRVPDLFPQLFQRQRGHLLGAGSLTDRFSLKVPVPPALERAVVRSRLIAPTCMFAHRDARGSFSLATDSSSRVSVSDAGASWLPPMRRSLFAGHEGIRLSMLELKHAGRTLCRLVTAACLIRIDRIYFGNLQGATEIGRISGTAFVAFRTCPYAW